MPPLAIAAITIGVGVGAAIVGSRQQKKAQSKAQQAAEDSERRAAQRADETTRRIEEATRLTPEEQARERRLLGVAGVDEATERRRFEEGIERERESFERDVQARQKSPFGKPIIGQLGFRPTPEMLQNIETERQTFEEDIERRRQEFETGLKQRVSAGARGEEGLEQRRGTELERRAGVPGEELLKEVGPQTTALLQEIEERQGLTGEELFRREGEIPRALQERVLEGARRPGGTFEDTLQQQLELARLSINAEANKRGVFGGTPEGGIRFEQLGRAGVELAIGSARERESARQQDLVNASALATQFLNLSAAARGEGAQVGEAGRLEQERARTELANFLQNTQQLVARGRERQATGVVTGQQFDIARTEPAAVRREGVEQDIFGIQAGQGARLQEAGLQLAGKAITGGIPSLAGVTTPGDVTGRLPSEFEQLTLEEGFKERLGRQAGRGF